MQISQKKTIKDQRFEWKTPLFALKKSEIAFKKRVQLQKLSRKEDYEENFQPFFVGNDHSLVLAMDSLQCLVGGFQLWRQW